MSTGEDREDHEGEAGEGGDEQKKGFKAFTATDIQRRRLDKLMQNIDKPIELPPSQRGRERRFAEAPEFVRNVMGSSAGAGSGEFHVYRHLRRKEFARQRHIEEEAKREKLDEQFKQRMEAHRREAEERTAKKRAKRLKKKQKHQKRKQLKPNQDNDGNKDQEESDDDDSSDDNDDKSEKQE